MKRIISYDELTTKTLDEIIKLWIKDITKDWKFKTKDIIIWDRKIETQEKIQVRFSVNCDVCDANHEQYTEWELIDILIENYFWKTKQGKDLQEKLEWEKKIEIKE